MTTLRDLAEAARMMPWDKTRADIPFACRKAFSDAMTPEIFLEMLEALREIRSSVLPNMGDERCAELEAIADNIIAKVTE